MPPVRKIRLFISHAWDYNHQYYRLIELLQQRPYFDFANYSVPAHDPLDTRTIRQLEEALRNHIRPCQVVLVMAGVYSSYRNWIKKELVIASELDKPIVGVIPWGAQRISLTAQDYAHELARWNADSIVDAIRKVLK